MKLTLSLWRITAVVGFIGIGSLASAQVTMSTTATGGGKTYLSIDNKAVVTNIDTLFARLNALSSSVSSLTWGDVLDNSAVATQDLDLNGKNATGANRIQGDSLEADVAIVDSLVATVGIRSTGTVTAGGFVGNLTGNVTGDLTGSATVGAGETLNVSAGTLTLADDQISGNKIDGGRISNLIDLDTDSLHAGWGEFSDSLSVLGHATFAENLSIADSLLVAGHADIDGSLLVGRWVRAQALRADSSLAVSGAASNWNSTALGGSSSSTGVNAAAIGYNASATNTQAVALGSSAAASGINAVAIGDGSSAAGTQSVAVGKSATVSSSYANVAVGVNASIAGGWGNAAVGGGRLTGTGTPTHNVAIGASTISSNGAYNTSLGYSSTISGSNTTGSMTFGPSSTVSGGYRNMAFGANSSITGGNSNYAFGDWSSVTDGWNSAAFGNNSKVQTNAANAYAFGAHSSVGAFNTANFAYASPARFSNLALFGSYADTTAMAPSALSHMNWIPTDPLFVVANGASDGARSNTLTILKNGKATFSDSLAVEGIASFASELSVGDTLHAAAPALFADSVYVGGNLAIAGVVTADQGVVGPGLGSSGSISVVADGSVNLVSGNNSGFGDIALNSANGEIFLTSQGSTSAVTMYAERVNIDNLLNIKPQATTPGSPLDGDIWFEQVSPTQANLKIYYNGSWYTIQAIP
jgi:hypothetical protein